jgi:hypothetical protein
VVSYSIIVFKSQPLNLDKNGTLGNGTAKEGVGQGRWFVIAKVQVMVFFKRFYSPLSPLLSNTKLITVELAGWKPPVPLM